MAVDVSQLQGYATSITIEELTPARVGGTPRIVILNSSGLPKAGAGWASALKAVTTWYPGNGEEATQQILGFQLMPSNWEGMWRRTLLGRAPVQYTDVTGTRFGVVDPMVLRQIFEDIQAGGQQLRVTWGVSGSILAGSLQGGEITEQNFLIVREGIMANFEANPERHTDIPWKVTFDWYSRGRKVKRVADVKPTVDPTTLANGLMASLNATTDAMKPFVAPRSISQTLGDIENLIQAPSQVATTQLENVLGMIESAQKDFLQAANLGNRLAEGVGGVVSSVVGFGTNVKTSFTGTVDSLGQIPIELQSAGSTVDEIIRSGLPYATLTDFAYQNMWQAVQLEVQARQLAMSGANRDQLPANAGNQPTQGDVLAVYITREGDTPEILSVRFYSSPDNGTAILKVNRLPWTLAQFQPGTQLTIPTLAAVSRLAPAS